MNINRTLREICDDTTWYNIEFDKSPINTFNTYNASSFAQLIRIFSNYKLNSISPAECDLLMNTLLRDTTLFNENYNTFINIANHLIHCIKILLQSKNFNKQMYRLEYAKFMNEREKYRNSTNTDIISKYNNQIITIMLLK
jgi:hypothetical protein